MRAKVTVNGRVVGSKLPHDAVLVAGPDFPLGRLTDIITDGHVHEPGAYAAGPFHLGSEWTDGTGTTVALIPNPGRQP